MYSLKPVATADITLLSELEAAIFPDSPWHDEQIKDFLHNSYQNGYILYDDNFPLGYVLWQKTFETIELLRIGIQKEYRQAGHGSYLLQAFIHRMAQFPDSEKIFLEVRADHQAVHQFYEKMGFKAYGRRKNYYRDHTDALLYVYDFKECTDGK